MNLREFITASVVPHPNLEKLREYFRSNDRSIFVTPDFMEMSFSEKTKWFSSNFIKIYNEIVQQYPDQFAELISNMDCVAIIGGIYMTHQAFYPPLKLLATPEQLSKWSKLILEGRVFGAYAQTEIGHGSDVQSLETVAIFNQEKKCFILNSPSTSSIKFWPGALGCQATHAICQAQTYIHGKHYGLQTFVVPLRDTKTYKLFDRLEVGDIGPKLAYSWNDNGYLKFNNYPVPLENLLMKFLQVQEDGTVIKEQDKNVAKIGYGGMLGLRVKLSKYFLNEGIRGTLMGYRGLMKAEPLHSLKKRELAKDLSFIYSNLLAIEWVTRMYARFTENISKNLKEALRELTELHIIACALKAYYSTKVVDQLRKYSQIQPLGSLMFSGTVSLYGDTLPSVTYEGDNVVMLQQTSKGLCKYMQYLENEEFHKVPESMKFLVELREFLEKKDEVKVKITSTKDLLNLEVIEKVIGIICLFSINSCYQQMKEMIMNGESINITWNEKLQESMIEMATVSIKGMTFMMTKLLLQSQDIHKKFKQKDLELLKTSLSLHGLDILYQDLDLACRFGIGGNAEELNTFVIEAQELTFKKIEDDLDYMAESSSFFEEDFYYVRDYKQRVSKFEIGDRIKNSLGSQRILPKL